MGAADAAVVSTPPDCDFFVFFWLDLLDENLSIGGWCDGSGQRGGFVSRICCLSVFQGNLAEQARSNSADACPCQKCWPGEGKLCFPTLTGLQQTHRAAQVPALAALQMQGPG